MAIKEYVATGDAHQGDDGKWYFQTYRNTPISDTMYHSTVECVYGPYDTEAEAERQIDLCTGAC